MLLLTLTEFAFLADRTNEAVRWDVRLGKIKSVMVGHRRLIPATELGWFYQAPSNKPLYL